MKKKLFQSLPYIIVLFLDFDLLLFLVPLMGGGNEGLLYLTLIYMPFIAFITSLMYGIFNGFDFILPIITIFLFALQMFFFIIYDFIRGVGIDFIDYILYPEPFLLQAGIYFIIVSLGVLIGYVIHMLLKFLGKIFRILFELL